MAVLAAAFSWALLAAETMAPVVAMRVDATVRHPISPWVYGLNFAERASTWGTAAPRGITLTRMGGNRASTYNWETNASNCGNDCGRAFPNDAFFGAGPPGAAVASGVRWARDHGAALLVTVPMLGWVAGDTAGPVSMDAPVEVRRARFKVSKAKKGAPFARVPDPDDAFVYQDEFVAWVEASAGRGAKVFYSLDNEPDLWGSTHEEVRGNRLADRRFVLTGYDELCDRSVEYAAAVKDVAPGALVFGPALSNWNGFANLYHNGLFERVGQRFFLSYYLEAMRRAGEARGRRLLDVLDVHWYGEVTTANHQSIANDWAPQDDAMIEARVQAPRSLWDPTFRERSWVADAIGGPVRLLPRLRELVAESYPGTRIAITEYSWHRGGDVSGAIAQADTLGIFGREDVFAATLWPLGSPWSYGGDAARVYACTFAAFRAFRDFDGRGSTFGDVSLQALTTDVARTSVYASADAADPGRLVLVLINKSPGALTADVSGLGPSAHGEVWQLTGRVGACRGPEKTGDVRVEAGRVSVMLPPLSVSTVALRRGA